MAATLGVLLLGEAATLRTIMGVLSVILGVYLAAANAAHEQKDEVRATTGGTSLKVCVYMYTQGMRVCGHKCVNMQCVCYAHLLC